MKITDEPQREMTLEEWVGTLPASHRVHKELAALKLSTAGQELVAVLRIFDEGRKRARHVRELHFVDAGKAALELPNGAYNLYLAPPAAVPTDAAEETKLEGFVSARVFHEDGSISAGFSTTAGFGRERPCTLIIRRPADD